MSETENVSPVTTSDWSEADDTAFKAMESEALAPRDEPEEAPAEPVEPVAAEPAVETDDDDDDAAESPQKPGFVPHRKLHKEIEKRKAAEERESVTIKRLDDLLSRLNPAHVAQPEPKQEEPPAPVFRKPDDDIFGAVEDTQKSLEELREENKQRKEREDQEVTRQRVIRAASEHERTFSEKQPDYNDALAYLRESRIEELKWGAGMDRAQAIEFITGEELNLAHSALTRRQSPAEVAYALAKARGYKRVEAKAEEAVEQPANESPAERIARTAEAASKSRTLSGGGSAPKPDAMNGLRLARMSEEEFAKVMNTPEVMKLLGA
jgi:hypothetical protein